MDSINHINSLQQSLAPVSFRSTPMTALEQTWQQRLMGNDTAATGLSFASMLSSALAQVEGAQRLSDELTVGMLLGSVELHEATIAMEKASLTLRTFVQVRDRMLEAYQEIMRMQV